MRAQAFQLRKLPYGGQRFLQRGTVVFEHAGAALKLFEIRLQPLPVEREQFRPLQFAGSDLPSA